MSTSLGACIHGTSRNVTWRSEVSGSFFFRWINVVKKGLGGGFIFFYFHPYLGKIPNLTNIFQRGWNHQPVFMSLQTYPEKNKKFNELREPCALSCCRSQLHMRPGLLLGADVFFWVFKMMKWNRMMTNTSISWYIYISENHIYIFMCIFIVCSMFYLYLYTWKLFEELPNSKFHHFSGPAVGFRGPVAMMAIFLLEGVIKLPTLGGSNNVNAW